MPGKCLGCFISTEFQTASSCAALHQTAVNIQVKDNSFSGSRSCYWTPLWSRRSQSCKAFEFILTTDVRSALEPHRESENCTSQRSKTRLCSTAARPERKGKSVTRSGAYSVIKTIKLLWTLLLLTMLMNAGLLMRLAMSKLSLDAVWGHTRSMERLNERALWLWVTATAYLITHTKCLTTQ